MGNFVVGKNLSYVPKKQIKKLPAFTFSSTLCSKPAATSNHALLKECRPPDATASTARECGCIATYQSMGQLYFHSTTIQHFDFQN